MTTIERDGLTARLAGVAEAMAEPWLPFFIQRDPDIEDPGAGGDAGGIAWIELTGDTEPPARVAGRRRGAAGALRGRRRARACAPSAWAPAPSSGERLERVGDRRRGDEQARPGARRRIEVADLRPDGACRASHPRRSPRR